MQRTLFVVYGIQSTPWNYMHVLMNIWNIDSWQILAPKCLISALVHLLICVVETEAEDCLHVVVCKLLDALCISVLYVLYVYVSFTCCRGWSRRHCSCSWTVGYINYISVLYVCMCLFLCCRGWNRRRCPYGRSWTVRLRSSLTLCTPRLSSNTCCFLWPVCGGSSCGLDTTVAGTPAWGPR